MHEGKQRRRAARRSGALGAGALAVSTLVGSLAAIAAEDHAVGLEGQSGLTLTIYNQDLALIDEKRRIEFAVGENSVSLLDVSARLRPETVFLEGDGLTLIEQSFEADVIAPRRLLQRALGQRVWVRRDAGRDDGEVQVEGELLSIAEQPVVRIDGRLESVPLDRLVFEDDLSGLHDKPTLTAKLLSNAAGARDLRLSYLSGGLSWQADYVASVNEAEDRIDLTGLVTLGNNSGTAFHDARLRLVAGEVNRAAPMPLMMARDQAEAMPMAAAPAPKMAEQAFGDQHLYELDRKISLAQRETKQVTLLTANSLPVTKQYRFEDLVDAYGGAEEIGPVKAVVSFEFENAAAGGLGKPLPAGVVRVYQHSAGAEAAPVFIGEDSIQHTPKGETVRLVTGRAFDVSGKAKRTTFERISDKSYDSGQSIEISNAKDETVTVEIVGNLPRGWRMLEESQPHEQETANRLVWSLEVPAGGSVSLSYKLRVTRP